MNRGVCSTAEVVSPPVSPARSRRFEALDGLRGVAAICVMLMHNGVMAFYNANLTVDLFFLLSVFVIAHC